MPAEQLNRETMFEGVIAIKQDGVDIYGVFIQETFVWPDPWVDIWDEGTAVLWDNAWHDVWSDNTTVPARRSSGNQ